MDIIKVKELLCHRHVTTTQIYDKRRRSTSESASHLLATVIGGIALGTVIGTPLTVTVSSIRFPSRRRSNTKSTSCPAAGAVVAKLGSKSSVQTNVRSPAAIQNTWINTGEPWGSASLEQAVDQLSFVFRGRIVNAGASAGVAARPG